MNFDLEKRDEISTNLISGVTKYWRNGLLHRDDGPAVIYPNGEMKWYQNGQLHREDGPACIFADGEVLWYLSYGGVEYEMTELEHFNISPYFQSLPPAERVMRRLMIR